MNTMNTTKYCNNPFSYERLLTKEVKIGGLLMGANHPIRIQSMTTADTMDTEAAIKECEELAKVNCELIRLTAPSKNEAENLRNIKEGLAKKNIHVPLVADIHFTPNAAEIAAKIVEKVRVNPGNYADKKKFEEINYTDETYQKELKRIEEKFVPLLEICKQHGTAIRIGTNHGSLSDRILSRFGDTPEGMVESAMEFIRICEKNQFDQLVISMKASNTLVMIQAYRLLVAEMLQRGVCYPLHLGVTEAGDGEDGRIKSAVGIGSLLIDGIGDTIRVSLTEDAIHEIPVAQKIVACVQNSVTEDAQPKEISALNYDPIHPSKHESKEILSIGGKHPAQVIADLSSIEDIKTSHLYGYGYHYSVPLDKYNLQDQAVDFIFIGEQKFNIPKPGALKIIQDYSTWERKEGYYPLVNINEIKLLNESDIAFLSINKSFTDWKLVQNKNIVLIFECDQKNAIYDLRKFRLNLAKNNVFNPIIIKNTTYSKDIEYFQIENSIIFGSQLVDGFGDGIWMLSNQTSQIITSTAFGILQATRNRISKTEYISCPSCGRTLFDLQETTQKIRQETSHLKGLKIGIMGCIVNGPGEMADADYGYVGSGPGKINLYKEKTLVDKNIPEDQAVEALKDLIKKHGDWIDPKVM